jgi:dTMP kinase
MPSSAQFIAIEGLDGSGGTTQVQQLAERLRADGRTVACTREPTDGPVGRLIRQALAPTGPASVLSDAVLPYLFAADRRDHIDRVVAPGLARGTTIITDRYVPSSLAYQGLTIGVEAAFRLNADFPAPQLTVVLEVDPTECMRRILARGGTLERFEDEARLRTIRDCYQRGLAMLEARGDRVLRLDGTLPIQALSDAIYTAVQVG